MSTVIRVSDSCYERLKRLAEPFVDTPSDVVERMLDFYDAHSEGDGRYGSPGTETPLPSLKGAEIPDDSGLIGREIVSFTFLGKEYHPRFAKEVLVTVASELYKRHSSDFDRCLHLSGRSRQYFSRNKNELDLPKRIANSPYYVMTKLDKDRIVLIAKRLMREFGYSDSDLTIVTG